MDISLPHAAYPWKALLWKDFRQVRPVLLAIGVGVIASQAFLLLTGLLIGGQYLEGVLGGSIALSVVAPFMSALGCSGMLVGHERQTRTWDWSSSLPIGWKSALLSKLSVTTAACVLLFLAAAILPAVALWQQGYTADLGPVVASSDAWTTPALVALLIAELIIVFFLASTLIRETLTALVVSGLAVLVWHVAGLLLGQAAFEFLRGRATMSGEAVDGLLMVSQAGSSVVFGLAALAWAFRWRWSIGQTATFSLRGSSLQLSPGIPAPAVKLGGPAPSERRMLLGLALKNAWFTRAAIVTATLLLTLTNLGTHEPGLAVMIIGIGSLLLGATVFEGDQSNARYRFLADRGVSPKKLLASRLLPALALCGLVGVLALILQWQQLSLGLAIPILWYVPVIGALNLFFLGALCSLCFARPIIAIVVTVVTGFVALVVVSLTQVLGQYTELQFRPSASNWLLLHTLAWSIVSVVILAIALVRLTPLWLIEARPQLHRYFCWLAPVTILLPPLLAATFGFLAIERVPWQGLPVSQLSSANVPLPPLERDANPLAGLDVSGDHWSNLRTGKAQQSDWDAMLADIQAWPPRANAQGTSSIEGAVIEYESILSAAATVPSDPQAFTRAHGRYIQDTALVGFVAAKNGDVKLSKRAWVCNRRFQETGNEIHWYSTQWDRALTWSMWSSLSDDELKALGGPAAIRSLLPDVARNSQMSDLVRETSLTLWHEQLSGNPMDAPGKGLYQGPYAQEQIALPTVLLKYFPPLRWRMLRQLSILQRQRTEPGIAVPATQATREQDFRWRLQLMENGASRGYGADAAYGSESGLSGLGGYGEEGESDKNAPAESDSDDGRSASDKEGDSTDSASGSVAAGFDQLPGPPATPTTDE